MNMFIFFVHINSSTQTLTTYSAVPYHNTGEKQTWKKKATDTLFNQEVTLTELSLIHI